MLGNEYHHYNKYKLTFNCVLLVTLASVLFVYPFNHHFRFTLGVVLLSALLLYFPRLSIIMTAVLSGVGILTTRIALDLALGASDAYAALLQALPAFGFYFFFGIGLWLVNIRDSIRDIPAIFAKLGVLDLLCNFIEFSIRNDLSLTESAYIIPTLAGVAILRSMLAVLAYYCLRYYGEFIVAEERFSRYAQLTMVFAQLRAELYYLHKSSRDIEQVMERSYLLYQQLNSNRTEDNNGIGGQALTIARDIHEIKKDYYRVINGIENILPSTDDKGLALSEVFYVIEQNTTRFLGANENKIKISFSRNDEFIINDHYKIVSVLNNLIINAIEASGEHGVIRVTETRNEHDIVFRVEDNGGGISDTDFELIFQPGYSTKYSEVTGTMSTGLGLAHVKNLVDSLGGNITVGSTIGEGTAFSIAVPYTRLVSDAGDNAAV